MVIYEYKELYNNKWLYMKKNDTGTGEMVGYKWDNIGPLVKRVMIIWQGSGESAFISLLIYVWNFP